MSYERIIARENGEKSRILVHNFALPGMKPDVGVDVFKQKPGSTVWEHCTQSGEERKTAMAMSRDDYLKHGRHPMFSAFSIGELLKLQVEAKRLGYANPFVHAALHFTNQDGQMDKATVLICTKTGMIDNLPENMQFEKQDAQFIQYEKEQLKVETNQFQQARVIDVAELQRVVIPHLLSLQKQEMSASPGPA